MYEFESEKELDEFFNKAKSIESLDPLFQSVKTFFEKYIDQDPNIIIILSADSILTYFQDLFPAIHYSEGIGTNDVGKSSIGYNENTALSQKSIPRIIQRRSDLHEESRPRIEDLIE
jgi:hypothetical protein